MPPSPTRYYATVAGQKEPVEVDILPLGPGRYALTIGKQRHEVDALTLPHGAVSLLVDGQSYNVEFDDQGHEVQVAVKNYVTRIDVVDERKLRLRAGRAGFSAEGRQVIAAPMPGKVVKVLVKVGDDVAQGQGLVVIEAMKMENEITAHKAGRVTSLTVEVGASINAGDPIATIE